jgi:hypothetical protein
MITILALDNVDGGDVVQRRDAITIHVSVIYDASKKNSLYITLKTYTTINDMKNRYGLVLSCWQQVIYEIKLQSIAI